MDGHFQRKNIEKAESLLILPFFIEVLYLRNCEIGFCLHPAVFSGAVAIGIPLIKVQLD
jgi:hypothetical protein